MYTTIVWKKTSASIMDLVDSMARNVPTGCTKPSCHDKDDTAMHETQEAKALLTEPEAEVGNECYESERQHQPLINNVLGSCDGGETKSPHGVAWV